MGTCSEISNSLLRHERIEALETTRNFVSYKSGLDHFRELLESNDKVKSAYEAFKRNIEVSFKNLPEEEILFFVGLDKLCKKFYLVYKNKENEKLALDKYDLDQRIYSTITTNLLLKEDCELHFLEYQDTNTNDEEIVALEIKWWKPSKNIKKVWQNASLNILFKNAKYNNELNYMEDPCDENVDYFNDVEHPYISKSFTSILAERENEKIQEACFDTFFSIFNSEHTALLPQDIVK